MAKSSTSYIFFSLPVIFYLPLFKAEYNIMSFGAKSNGHTDSTKAFLKAWSYAYSSFNEATIYVPSEKFLVGHVHFNGPCKSRVLIKMKGTLLAPFDYKGSGNKWIVFKNVDGLAIQGGTVDGWGQALWKCKESRGNCPHYAKIKMCNDCISMSDGTRNMWAERISCGPGHGISIGSIGKSYNEKGVQNITVKDTVFTGSDNGLRIKA
ncbi:hypothetical protein ZOSMA_86G00690 [Zostera marina]|uniref:Polygalacturonase, family GH28 n=1 Tax=Zostera marina TaxID=29655 RepID=A0A0K9NMW9_ZOSMR|nr:hypothetical protein ZOSMA_86G00690 [Zostera marina]